MVPR
jgi:hypothetical protein